MARKNFRGNVEPPKERISSSTGNLMVATALGLDLFQGIIAAIPLAGILISDLIINPIIIAIFWVWFISHKVHFGNNLRRLALMWGGFFLELIPILNILPIWTLTIFMTVLIVRKKDKKKIEEFYKNLRNATMKEKRYNVPIARQYVTARKAANDNNEQQPLKEAA